MSRENLHLNVHPVAKEVADIFLSDEKARKLFRKLLMAYIEMPTKWKRYTMDLRHDPGSRGTVETYEFRLRKNCSSNYTKRIMVINENVISNCGKKEYNSSSGISVNYDIDEFLKLFLREYKILSIVYG
jgi:hypothetical protein